MLISPNAGLGAGPSRTTPSGLLRGAAKLPTVSTRTAPANASPCAAARTEISRRAAAGSSRSSSDGDSRSTTSPSESATSAVRSARRPCPSTTQTVPAQTPARTKPEYGVKSASESTAYGHRFSVAGLASTNGGTSGKSARAGTTSRRQGRTGRFRRCGQARTAPRRQAGHSPQGKSRGTSTAWPTKCCAAPPASSTTPTDSAPGNAPSAEP